MSADENWGQIGALLGADAPHEDGELILGDKDEQGPSSTNESNATQIATAEPGPSLQTTVDAVALAQEVETPEGWQAVAGAARVLSEIAGTLAVVAHKKQMTRWLSQAAEEAERTAQQAAKAAAMAIGSLSQLNAAVATAAETNTASAWQEARRTALEAVGEAPADDSGQAPALRLKRVQPQ